MHGRIVVRPRRPTVDRPRRLLDRHFRFASSVIERLVARGVQRGETREVSASVVAAVLLAGAVHLAKRDVLAGLDVDLAPAIDDMLDLSLRGLAG